MEELRPGGRTEARRARSEDIGGLDVGGELAMLGIGVERAEGSL